ncbi:glycosyltransferase family 4 protein [Epilithonimonas sp. UC225_85]|uniref:glycosyltransferase family 4 protein n=1 Tax=Epilithonimonas sp. UC225_85 TaxID=3350167 RepID=UPI0036D34AE8
MEQKFKILIFAHDSTLYGATKSLLTLLDYWKKNHPEVEVLVLLPYKGILEDHFATSGISYKVVAFPRTDYPYKNQSFLYILKLRRNYLKQEKAAIVNISNIINDFQPDVIYTNTSVVGIGYEISKLFKIPFVWHIREFGWADYRLKYLPSVRSQFKKVRNSNTIFISKILQDHWIKNSKKKESKVIYNGFVEESVNHTMKEIPNEPIIGILGTIMPGKGQLEAIQAVEILNKKGIKATLEIYGKASDRVYEAQLKSLLENNRDINSYIKFCGFNENPKEIYDRISILLNCSRSEGFGRTIIEAMLENVPVVANNAGAIPEIIKDSYNGLVYEHTSESLANKLELLINNKILWKNITDNAFIFAKDNYSIKNYAESVLDFLKNKKK